ncbi:MAG: Mur ligase family protein [bacterium]|nr:Mur ligase family protein [bacterium]
MQEKFSAKDNSVLILGLGLQGGGVGVARFLARIGMDVTVSDRASRSKMAPSIKKLDGLPIKYIFGTSWDKNLNKYDFVVKNPGVPKEYTPLKKARMVTNDAEIFLTLAPRSKVIGVTGTKGKTTTASLVSHILPNSILVGIPGVSFFDCFFLKKEPTWIVAEFSSFDLEYITQSPRIVLFTSLFSDHLNRYPSFHKYAAAKMNLLKFQKKDDIALIANSKIIRAHLPKKHGKLIFISSRPVPGVIWQIPEISAVFAMTLGLTLGISKTALLKRIKSFKPVQGRIEEVAKKHGVLFINDTTATNPGSASYTFLQLKKHFEDVIVITGGEDKKFSAREIRDYGKLLNKASWVILLPGSFSDRLKKSLLSPSLVLSMDEAVAVAANISKKGTVIALIPGAASFNMFQNEFHRADVFLKAIKKIK